ARSRKYIRAIVVEAVPKDMGVAVGNHWQCVSIMLAKNTWKLMSDSRS
ncbi:MAG: hypothetical protein ACI8TQ_001550, partial [Planctomycetota bacterium]